MPPTNLNSFTTLCSYHGRNFSSYRRSYESKGVGMTVPLIRVTGTILGCYVGYIIHGGSVSEMEKKRQKVLRECFWYSGEIEDLTEKMWSDVKVVNMLSDLKKKVLSHIEGVKMLCELSEKACSDLREKTWSNPGERKWSDLRANIERMWSDLRANIERMWSDLRANIGRMWSDLREKMESDRKS